MIMISRIFLALFAAYGARESFTKHTALASRWKNDDVNILIYRISAESFSLA